MVEKSDKADIVKEAHKRFKRAMEAYSETRKLAIEDTKFALADSDNHWQWPDEVYREREGKRVCLTVNITAQHCNQIINDIRKNRPAVKVSPVDDGADKKTAEILAGLVRNIHVSSAADDAHDTAAEHAIYGGEGYWRVVTDYETPTSFNQVICVKAVPNPRQVFIDVDSKELDKSDACWGFVFEDIPIEQAEREHPDIKPASWSDDVKASGWLTEETIRRAEYFYCTHVKDTACLLSDGSTCLKSEGIPEGLTVVQERATEVKRWKWCKLVGGHDEPVDERDWPGDYLPIISVVGKEVNVDGEIVRKGQVRDLKDPARMVNYAFSETVQTLALQNKIPYLAAAEAVEGYEDEWKRANTSNDSYLPFNAYDDNGSALPVPQRQMPAVMPAAQIQLLELATNQMRAASGQQNANFGIKSEAQSGIGIQRLKVQGEMATFHFPDNLARALRYEGKVLVNLIPKIYDTKRVVRILGLDGTEEHATLDPEMQQPYMEQQTAQAVEKIFNPTLGRYDVVIDTGPSYQTLRQEGAANLNELASRNPALMQIAGDLIMKAQDFPMAEKLAERIEKTLPPELRDDDRGQAEIPTEVQQQMMMMGQQMQQMGQALQEAQAELQQAQQGMQVKREQAQIDASLTAEKIDADAKMKREQAIIDAEVALERAKIEQQTKLQIAAMEQRTDAQIACMKTGADMHKAEMGAMQGDGEAEGMESPEQPKPKTRRRVSIMAPSGAVYQGIIDDEAIELQSPEGMTYSGAITPDIQHKESKRWP